MFSSIFWVAVWLMAGIAAGRELSVAFLPWETLAICLCFLVLGFLWVRTQALFGLMLLAGSFFLGAGLYSFSISKIKNRVPEGFAVIYGKVDSFPERVKDERGVRTRFVLEAERFSIDGEVWKIFNQKILVVLSEKRARVEFGQNFFVKGEVLVPRQKNPGGFDGESYLHSQGISARMVVLDYYAPERLAQGTAPLGHYPLRKGWTAKIGRIKETWIGMLEKAVPERESAVVKAMLLGDRGEIEPEIRESFVKSGTAHLLAISGMNVGLIGTILVGLLHILRIPRGWSYAGAGALLTGYCILTGASASVLRSTIMICMILLGKMIDRESLLNSSLSWAAILILVFQPLQLFDPGFQLSFLTVFFLGTVFDSGSVEIKIPFLSGKLSGYLLTSVKMSTVAWIGILPCTAGYFYLFSPITVLANLVVVPLISLVTANGIALMFAGFLGHFFQECLGLSLWLFTRILITLCDWFAAVPYGSVRVAPPSALAYFVFYGLACFWVFRRAIKFRTGLYLCLWLVFFNGYVWKEVFKPRPKKLEVTFLDVGHGDSAFIQFPQKGNLLVDCGSGSPWDHGQMTIAPFLWSRGVTRLDAVLITHPHEDHYGGLRYLLKEFEVGAVYENFVGKTSGDQPFRVSAVHPPEPVDAYEKLFDKKKVVRRPLESEDSIKISSNLCLNVLMPNPEILRHPSLTLNDSSLIVQLVFKDIKFMLAGDAESLSLEQADRYGEQLRSQILKVPHHGSYSGGEEDLFLAWTNPKIALISEAAKNKYGLPSPKTLEILKLLGTQVYQTGLSGAVIVTTDGTGYQVKAFLPLAMNRPSEARSRGKK